MVTNPSLALSSRDKKEFFEEVYGHMADESGKKMYGLDDQSTLQVIDGHIKLVSEDVWKKFN